MSPIYNQQMFTVSSSEDDPIEALVRRGAKVMLQAALKQEVTQYLERARHQRSEPETDLRGYRNGSSRERQITIGSGTIKIKTPRISDVPMGQAQFESQIVKPYQRRSKSLAEVFPKLDVLLILRYGRMRLLISGAYLWTYGRQSIDPHRTRAHASSLRRRDKIADSGNTT